MQYDESRMAIVKAAMGALRVCRVLAGSSGDAVHLLLTPALPRVLLGLACRAMLGTKSTVQVIFGAKINQI